MMEKGVYIIFGYTGTDEDKLAELISNKLKIELVRDDDYYEDEGPYVFSGKGMYIVDYLCIQKQFRIGDKWENNYHKICPWAIRMSFVRKSGQENIDRAEKVKSLLNAIEEIKLMDFSVEDSLI